MTYELAIGDRTYSSWSLRGWLLFETFGLPVRVRSARMYSDGFRDLLADFPPARLVPAMKMPEGDIVWDSMAMAETLAERHPDIPFWPRDRQTRAMARAISAEMHSGFTALRSACTMNLRCSFDGFTADKAVMGDVERIETLWQMFRDGSGAAGPWLFGAWSLADVFYAPVATRIATYRLPVGPVAAEYVAAHLANPAFRRWRAMGIAENFIQPGYDPDLPEMPWPGPAPLAAKAVDTGRPENATCPYSGRPVSDLMAVDGRIFGFCNPFCRDKTVADPMAWPAFAAIYQK
ncbi:MAG: glutathione S-transferase [Rhodobacteraceae bacterium]|nr:glutathione S-transferase [Paracoccaceae bacterium]